MNKKIFILLVCIFPNLIFSKDIFQPVIIDFKMNKFQGALLKLKNIKGNWGKKNYYQGLCYNRLKNFNKAIFHFEKAKKSTFKNEDMSYELGQAFYATNNLIKSRKSFQRSVKQNYMKESSLYYMGHISQILEEHKLAANYFKEMFSNKKADRRLRQLGYFKYASSIYNLNEKNKSIKEIVKKEVLPHLKKGKAILKRGAVAKDITKRITELILKYDLDPFMLKNGKKLKPRPWNLNFSQKIKYDSNVTNQTELPTLRVVNNDSFIYDTSLTGSWRFIHRRQVLFTPVLKLNFLNHANRNLPAIYKNDTINIQGTMKSSWEHKLQGKPASLMFNIEKKIVERDRLSQKEKIFASRYTQFSLGEKFSFFKIGPTTVQIKYKDLDSYSSSEDSITRTLSINQIQMLKIGHLLVYTGNFDFTTVSLPSSSSSNFLFRADYIIPKMWPQYALNPYLSVTLTDTRETNPQRGTEVLVNPGIKLTKTVSNDKKFKITLGYSLQKKYSKDKTNYAFTKNELMINLKYKF